jgi:hypothetical protein
MFWAAVHIDFLIGTNRFFVMLQVGLCVHHEAPPGQARIFPDQQASRPNS